MSYNKYYNPTTWEDFPSENTAINAQRLNHLEDGVDELDDRICALDVNKSQVSWNQQLLTGDKIAEISINGVLKNVYAPNVDGASQQAQAAALVSEGYAQGTQGGSAVGPDSQYYHNNAKWWSEQSGSSRLISLEDVEIDNASQFQALLYDSVVQKWKNESLGLINLEQYGYQIGLKGSGGIPFGAISLPHDPDKANENQIAFVNEDSSSILPVQEAARAFSKGEHFMQRGYFCTALTDIAQFDTLVRNTNYKREKVADYLSNKDITSEFTWNETNLSFNHKSVIRCGNTITINVRFTVTSIVQTLPIATNIPEEYMPAAGWYFGNVVKQWNGGNVSNVIYRFSNVNQLYAPNSADYQVNSAYTGTFTYICNGV